MSRTMFARIMLMVFCAILLMGLVIGAMTYSTLRTRQTDSRLESLKKDAREIVWLAAQDTGSTRTLPFQSSSSLTVLRAKAQSVYEEYGAYILVVDRNGRLMDNYTAAMNADPDFIASLSEEELSSALTKVLSGEEIEVRTMVRGEMTFTVGVPFVRNERVLGAVLMQTPAVKITAGLGDWLRPPLLASLLALLLCTIWLFFYVRSVMKPIGEMATAARSMAQGDFSRRVNPGRISAETRELSSAFNLMASRLGDVERSRREFVANVSHELRSPITSISGYVQGMEDGTIPPEEHAHYLHIVGDETRRLSGLISQLLALSRLEREDAALELTDYDICEQLRRAVIRRMNDLEQRGMEIETDFQLDPCMVHADSDRIEQVIINLMDNAIKFTPEGGCITLRTAQENGVCVVRVQDNGAGIAPEDRPHVFERFFTADRAHTAGKGTGLGLAISQRILEMHGHTILLEDIPGVTSFAFTLDFAGKHLPAAAKEGIINTIDQKSEDTGS